MVRHLTLRDYYSILQIKKNLKRSDNMLLYKTLAFPVHGKIYRNHTKIIDFKYQL